MHFDENMREYFKYLNELRDSGETNMFGAVPYLVDEYDLTPNQAKQILLSWMKSIK